MKVRTIALNTFGSFLRNKLLILFFSLFLCLVLLMMSPLLARKAMTTAANTEQMEALVLSTVGLVMSLVSGFGSLLAAWAAADAVASEMKSGTVLAVMARPLRRWEFLAGKYLGVMLLLAVYVAFMLVVSYFLAWLGGQHIHAATWTLILYPLVRYAIYAAISMLLVTMLHPMVTVGLILVLATVSAMVQNADKWPGWLRIPLYAVLPSTGLLSEGRFIELTQATLKPVPWSEHLTAMAYGLDYALVCFLLAVWSFSHRSLTPQPL